MSSSHRLRWVEEIRRHRCGRCRVTFEICRSCDRGHLYCCRDCSTKARKASVWAARLRHRKSPEDRADHRERERARRARRHSCVGDHVARPAPPWSFFRPMTRRGRDRITLRLSPISEKRPRFRLEGSLPTDLPPFAVHQLFSLLVYWSGRSLHAVLSAGGPVVLVRDLGRRPRRRAGPAPRPAQKKRAENLTAYEAWYVAIAEALGVKLATLDRALCRTAGPRCGFLTRGSETQ